MNIFKVMTYLNKSFTQNFSSIYSIFYHSFAFSTNQKAP